MLKLLEPLAGQKTGYSFGKPTRVDDKSLAVIVPILRETSLKRQYITLPETEKVNIFDTGKIDEMEAENQSGETVYLRSGTLFKGATQERALQRSVVLFVGKKAKMSVRCVHMTRGINPNSAVKYGGLTPHDFDTHVYGAGYTPKDQTAYWQSAATTSNVMFQQMSSAGGSSCSADFPSHHIPQSFYFSDTPTFDSTKTFRSSEDNLAANLDKHALHFDELLSKVKRVEHQSGLALITASGVETIETFDHADSWTALHDAAIKRLGTAMLRDDRGSVFEYKPEHAHRQINEVLALDWKTNVIWSHRPNNGEPSIEMIGLSCGDYVGEVTEISGNVVHLVILKKAP
jgi:hypothetical protein